MRESRHILIRMAKALGMPLVIVVAVPLALMAALWFYLLALAQGFWQLLRVVPGWVLTLKNQPSRQRPHIGAAHSQSKSLKP